MGSPTKELNVRVSAEVKKCLVDDAAEQSSSINDLAVGILAQEFRIRFDGTGRRSPGAQSASDGPMILRIPEKLDEKIRVAAARRPKGSRTNTAAVEAVLRKHYEDRGLLSPLDLAVA